MKKRHSAPSGAKFLRFRHDPSQTISEFDKKFAKLLQYIRDMIKFRESFSLISCLD